MAADMTVIALVTSSFVATNVDNLLILVAWMLGGRLATRRLLGAYSLAAAAVLLVALLFGTVSNLLPVQYLGYLGIIPVLLGLKMLAERFQANEAVSEKKALSSVAVATALFANSVDTILVFAPLLADSAASVDPLIAASYVLVAGAWFAVAWWFSRNVARLARVTMIAQWVAPLIMIAVGLYILDNTATDVVAGP